MMDLDNVAQAAGAAVQRGAERAWNLADLDWGGLRPDLLTDADKSVVRFITFVEDHIPGYVTCLLRAFPVDGAEDDLPVVALNREYFRFFIAWAYDEERHASVLTRYQEAAGLADPQELRLELAAEGRHETLEEMFFRLTELPPTSLPPAVAPAPEAGA